MTPLQLPLPLPVRPALGRGDFFVSPANALAVAQIDAWPAWPGNKLLLAGPARSGKSHLAQVWASRSGARIVDARAITAADVPDLARAPLCIENAGAVAGDAQAETALFHCHNLVLAEGHSLLVTDRRPPARWGLGLPDLESRMQGTPLTRLDAPDDMLLGAVLHKLFEDRQVVPAADVIPYLVVRMPRAFTAAEDLVTALDRAAMGTRGGVTRALARRILQETADQVQDDADGPSETTEPAGRA